MSLELQLRSAVLRELMIRTIQARLGTSCLPPLDPTATIYIDHIDVLPALVQFSQVGPQLEMRAPLAVYLVRRQDVLAAPNAVPAGATTKAGTVTLVCSLAVSGTRLEMRFEKLDLGDFGAAPGVDQTVLTSALKRAVGSLGSVDLSGLFTGLGVTASRVSDVTEGPFNVAVRFDPVGTATDRTLGAQIWGLFIDAQTMMGLVVRQFNGVPNISTSPRWQPKGSSPFFEIELRVNEPLPDPFAGSADAFVKVGCDISLTPAYPPQLQTLIRWSFDRIEIHSDFPGFLEGIVEDVVIPALRTSIDSVIGTCQYLSVKSPPAPAAGLKITVT